MMQKITEYLDSGVLQCVMLENVVKTAPVLESPQREACFAP